LRTHRVINSRQKIQRGILAVSTSRTGDRSGPAGEEVRQAERRRALLGGMIVSSDGRQSLGCTVRDISESGARILLPHTAMVPGRLFLLTSRQPTAWDARIVWRNATQAGLAFAGEHTLSPDMGGGLQFLWRLYLELGPRVSNPFEL
jgi:hypothetical protein